MKPNFNMARRFALLSAVLLTAAREVPAITPTVPTPTFSVDSHDPSNATRTVTATASARAFAYIEPSTSIAKRADLHFQQGAPGAPPEVISSEDAANAAALVVTGKSNQAYNLILPKAVSLNDKHLDGEPPIVVSDFNANMPIGNLGIVPSGDKRPNPLVGATREAIPVSQQPGNYTGTFLVTVAYQ